jgi:hypothetical protein
MRLTSTQDSLGIFNHSFSRAYVVRFTALVTWNHLQLWVVLLFNESGSL